jgi:hypothetical protein
LNKKTNLKKDYNARGSLGEFLANNYMMKYRFPCSYYDGILRLKNKKHREYIKWYGYSIDGFVLDRNHEYDEKRHTIFYNKIAVVYEVKTRLEDTKSKSNLTEASLKSYMKAFELDIPVKYIIVTFYDNNDIEIQEKD